MSTVPEIFDMQIANANNFLTQAQGFINRVADLANTEFTVPLPTGLGFGLTDYTSDVLDKIDTQRPSRPTFGDIAALSPTSPILDFREIDESLIVAVRAKILGDLENGGYGIETSDEQALFQRERDREDQIALEAVEEVSRKYAEGGFPMPSGAQLTAVNAVLQARSDKLSTVNRDIALRRSDLYFAARKFAMEHAGTIEGVILQLHRTLNEQMQIMTALYQAQVQQFRAEIDADVEVLRANLGIYSADVQAFAASISAIAEAYRLRFQENQLNNAWNVDVMRAKLEEARIKLQSQVSGASVRTGNAQFGAEYYSRGIAAALGSVNALTSQSATD